MHGVAPPCELGECRSDATFRAGISSLGGDQDPRRLAALLYETAIRAGRLMRCRLQLGLPDGAPVKRGCRPGIQAGGPLREVLVDHGVSGEQGPDGLTLHAAEYHAPFGAQGVDQS